MARLTQLGGDATPEAARGLGAAGGAIRGFRAAKREQADDEERQAQRQRDRTRFDLGVRTLKDGIEQHQRKLQQDAALRRDEQEANALLAQGMRSTVNADQLGPQVTEWWDRAVDRAATLEPKAGQRFLAGAAVMLEEAEREQFRDNTKRKLHDAVATGYWRQLEADVAALGGGVDIDGDGTPDVDANSIASIGEGLLAQMEDPDADVAQVAQDFDTFSRALEAERTRLNRRVQFYNRAQGALEERLAANVQSPFGAGNATPPVPMEIEQEIRSMLEQYRRGELGDGDLTERELESSIVALVNGKRRVALPPGHPLGRAIEVDAASSGTLSEEGLYRLLGIKASSPREIRAERVNDAYARAGRILSASLRDMEPEDAQAALDKLAQRIDGLAYPDEPIDFGLGMPVQSGSPSPAKSGILDWSDYPEDKEWALGQAVELTAEAMQGGGDLGAAIASAFRTLNIDPRTLPPEVKEAFMRQLQGQ